MSIQVKRPVNNCGSAGQPHLEQPPRKCCKIKHRVRYFYSKGAFFVLFWTFLISAAGSDFYFNLIFDLVHQEKYPIYPYIYFGIPFVVLPFACIPLAGWLADAKLGNFKVFQAGSILFFLSATVGTILFIVVMLCHLLPHGPAAIRTLGGSLGAVGVAASLATALQLGLDQMPDASAANITSFVAWFVCSLFAGAWVSDTLFKTLMTCVEGHNDNDTLFEELLTGVEGHAMYITISECLLPSVCMAIVCCSLFIFAPNNLVVEPESPKSLKTIYQVLKFAAKHKAPLNRSALTYWEDDIPSRLDLGKSKYGGPFTTEQVEDVKTFLKILVIHIPIFIIFMSMCTDIEVFKENTTVPFLKDQCSSHIFRLFTSNRWWSVILTTVIYEFGIFPLIRNKIPTTLTRIGIASFLLLIIKSTYTAESIVNYYSIQTYQMEVWSKMLLSFLKGSVIMFIANGVLEFVCAQSPYNMRGLLTSSTIFLVLCSGVLSVIIQYLLKIPKLSKTYAVICNSIAAAFSLFGFILHCILARWYKRRVRDEDYSPHRVVEEIYDRYLSHVQ